MRTPVLNALTAVALLALIAAIALPVALASALETLPPPPEQTRQAYVAAVEPICKTDKQASDHYLKGVSALVKHDKLTKAAANFTKAAAALEKAAKQLAAVPPPPADSPKLAQWLAGIRGEGALMRQIAAKLRQGDKAKASSIAVKLQRNANTTNNLVIGFQFNYCHIDPSKYT